MRKKKNLLSGATLILLFLFLNSCDKNNGVGDLPFNPYDTINYNNNAVPPIPIDSNSFLGIHQYILSVKCAVNGCHDGSFEPDYRTVQSAYSTLVYATVVKNTPDNFYTYRVVPNDPGHSWLWYRLTTTDLVLGKMPLYDTLYPGQLDKIKNWIMNGAPDLFGNSPVMPTYLPAFYGMVAYLTDQNNYRVDTIRGASTAYPFAAAQNVNLRVWMGLYDDLTYPWSFTYNKVRLSTDPFNWDNAIELPLQLTMTPWYEDFYGFNASFYCYFDVNTSLWNLDDVVYIRAYVQDADHSSPTEIPDNGSQIYLQTYCSFIIQ